MRTIDESWYFFTQSDSPTTSKFILQGFRTARKYSSGFGVLTPNLDVIKKYMDAGLPVPEAAEKVFEEQEARK